jgi:folate-binding protein YgfZ
MQRPANQQPALTTFSDIGFIRVEGRDSERFLHNQLSQNVMTISADRAPLAAWHSAAGKVKAIVRVLRLEEYWLLTTAADLVEPVVADLRRYVLRDDITITNDNQRWQAAALLGDTNSWLEEHAVGLGTVQGDVASSGGLLWLRLGPELVHIYGSAADIAAFGTELADAERADAVLAETVLGLPQLSPELQSRFVPQMLNLDLLGALDENKGCYPGQEIIARTQNLGTVKRRMLRFSAKLDRAPEIGTRILNQTGSSVGEVIRSVATNGCTEILAVTQLENAGQTLACENDREVLLQREALPYENQ